jgi:hypothetical protein
MIGLAGPQSKIAAKRPRRTKRLVGAAVARLTPLHHEPAVLDHSSGIAVDRINTHVMMNKPSFLGAPIKQT